MPKTHKITEEQLRLFEGCCRNWQRRLGLIDWDLYVEIGDLGDADECYKLQAECSYLTSTKEAVITINKAWSFDPTDQRISEAALHECLHLLMADFCAAYDMGRSKQDIASAEHGVIHRLTRVLEGTEGTI